MLLTFSKTQFEHLIKQGIKQHTIREDKHNRWRVGSLCHFWMGNPRNINAANKPHSFGTGVISKISSIAIYPGFNLVLIDGRKLSPSEIENLAYRDGFESWADMKTFFCADFHGKVLFWNNCVFF